MGVSVVFVCLFTTWAILGGLKSHATIPFVQHCIVSVCLLRTRPRSWAVQHFAETIWRQVLSYVSVSRRSIATDSLSEWLRRWTQNPLGSAHVATHELCWPHATTSDVAASRRTREGPWIGGDHLSNTTCLSQVFSNVTNTVTNYNAQVYHHFNHLHFNNLLTINYCHIPSSSVCFSFKWTYEIMVILDTTEHASNKRGRTRLVALGK